MIHDETILNNHPNKYSLIQGLIYGKPYTAYIGFQHQKLYINIAITYICE